MITRHKHAKKNILNIHLQIGLNMLNQKNLIYSMMTTQDFLKKCIDGILKSMNFGKEFDCQALSETNNHTISIKHLEEKIN